jgi:hypothetical protein
MQRALALLVLTALAAANDSSFPYVPASTVALLRFSGLNATYAKAVEFSRVHLPHESPAPTLAAALNLPPNFRALDLDQPFTAAVLLHASGNLSAPFVPGYLAAPVPALLLLLPGVSVLHLAQLPGLEPANDGDPSHYLIPNGPPGMRATLGAFGDTGALVLGLGHYDLARPPSTSLRLPASAVATVNASTAALVLELSQLEVLLKPLLLAGPSLLTLLGTLAGTALEYTPVKAELARLGLSPGALSALTTLGSEFFELALTLAGDTRAVLLSARLEGRSELHLGVHACLKPGSYTAKLNTTPATTASLWPDLPASPDTLLAAGDALSPGAVAEFEKAVFGPALAQLDKAAQGGSPSPAASLLRDAITLLRDLNGPTDGVQAALVDNGGAAAAGHANCPPDLPLASRTLLAPGVVALFAKGNTVADVWQRHTTMLSALRTAIGPDAPWARPRSLGASGGSAQALLTARDGSSGGACEAAPHCAACLGSHACMWSVPQRACAPFSASRFIGEPGVVASARDCPHEAPPEAAGLAERPAALAELATSSQNRTIGGVVFENRRILLHLQLDLPLTLVVDTAVGMVGGRVMAFGVLSDAAVLPYVQAALRAPAPPLRAPAAAAGAAAPAAASIAPLFGALPVVNATFARLPKSRSSVLALRPAALLRYYRSVLVHALGRDLTPGGSEPLVLTRAATVAAVLEEEGATVGLTVNPTAEGVPAGIELHTDLAVRARAWLPAPLVPASRYAPPLLFAPRSHCLLTLPPLARSPISRQFWLQTRRSAPPGMPLGNSAPPWTPAPLQLPTSRRWS